MFTARICLGFFCAAFIGSNRLPERNLLKNDVLAIASQEVGVRERTGNNDGERIEEYLHTVGLHRGDPYCAAFVSWLYKKAGYPGPRTGWSPDLFPTKRLVKDPKPEDVFGVYIASKRRIAHCGIVERMHSDFIYTIEANTNNSGGAEGDGVYRRMRHKRSISKYASWKGGKS